MSHENSPFTNGSGLTSRSPPSTPISQPLPAPAPSRQEEAPPKMISTVDLQTWMKSIEQHLNEVCTISSEGKLNSDQENRVTSVGSIPMIFGNFLIPAVMARAGRKVAMYSVILVLMLGWFTVILATCYEVLLFGRVLQGMSFGMFMPLRSVFIGECTSPRYRGGFLSSSALAQSCGVLLVHLTGSLISYQLTALVSVSFAFISLILTIYSPESPSWLATRGKYDKCRKNFIWLRGDEEIPELDKMIQAVKHLEAQKNNNQSKLREMTTIATKKEFYKPVFLMSALYVMLTQAGGPVMGAYSVTVLSLLMGPKVNAHFWMVALDMQRLVSSGVAIYVIHKVKRRTMLFSFGALCAGSQLCMGVYMLARTKGFLPFDSLWIPAILINLQMLSISMGMQPLPAVIAGEVYPLQYRAFAGSIGLIAQCGSVFLLLKTFPSLVSFVGLHGAYAWYSGVIAACLLLAWFLLPETRGRTLQQIEEHFRGKPILDPENPVADRKETEPLNEVKEKLTNKIPVL